MAAWRTEISLIAALVAILVANELIVDALDSGYKDVTSHRTPVLCYVGSWAKYRTGDGFFDAATFDPRLCSYVIYSFAGLDPSTHEIKVLDPQSELDQEDGGKDGFKSYLKLKEKFERLKVLIAIGGWNEGSEKYSAMAETEVSRRKFVDSVVAFLRKHKFDGLDVDWEFPTQRGGKPQDKDHFTLLLKELRSAFDKHGWILSVAISAAQYIIEQAYDIPKITHYVEFISVMSYDYHGKWDNKTGFNSPLYQRKDGSDSITNMNHTISLLLKLGALEKQLVLGLPFYGRTFTLDEPSNSVTSLGASAHEPGPKGKFTKEANFMGYNEICQEIASPSWTKKWDPEQRVPFAYKDKSWISYDDKDSLGEKVGYALSRGLLGVMIWSVETDDVHGRCHDGQSMFLLKSINELLAEEFDKDNVVATDNDDDDHDDHDDDQRKTEKPFEGSDGMTIHASLKIWMILTVWVLHVLRQKMDNA